ncbi:hypothetical protein Leryth_022664 [Lithospermum erythrorhizon]|nr:hypothetical protein Leryth_022664 [Lithospermum erythrorhizon]
MADDDTNSTTSSLFSFPSSTTISAAENNNVRCVGRSGNCVTWGCTSVIGLRKEMEDAVKVVPGFMMRRCNHVGGCIAAPPSDSLAPVHFFAVYDGHGGAQVGSKLDGYKWEVILARSTELTVNLHYKWHQNGRMELLLWYSHQFTRSAYPIMVKLRVLCRGTETIPLSIDQKPDREDELARIEDQGGHVIYWNGARVFGVLSMSRAIGDHHLRPWVIPVPEITFTTRRDDDECLILASDGLWDVMSNDEVGEVARTLLLKLHSRRLVSNNG